MSSLQDVRHALLALHRAVLEAERQVYERTHGRQTAGQFLDAVIHAADLAWLQPMTAAIVRLDEELEGTARDASREDDDVVQQLRGLLRPDPEGASFSSATRRCSSAAPRRCSRTAPWSACCPSEHGRRAAAERVSSPV